MMSSASSLQFAARTGWAGARKVPRRFFGRTEPTKKVPAFRPASKPGRNAAPRTKSARMSQSNWKRPVCGHPFRKLRSLRAESDDQAALTGTGRKPVPDALDQFPQEVVLSRDCKKSLEMRTMQWRLRNGTTPPPIEISVLSLLFLRI